MPLFDFVTIPSLLVLAASSPMPGCTAPKAAEITVRPITAPVQYDYSQTLVQMQNQVVDTINPYDFTGPSRTQGLMSGSLKIEPEVKINYQEIPSGGAVCLWYDKIDVSLALAPTIMLAREVFHDPCMREAVLDHEMKHVMVERQLVNKYAKVIGDKIYEVLQSRGFKAGPVPIGQAEEIAGRMQQTVFQVVGQEFKRLELEQTDEQQKIDSFEEYERVNALCPNFRKKYAVRKAFGH